MLKYLVAVAIGFGIWIIAVRIIRMLAETPPEADPAQVVPTDINYRCSICGTEVTMTAVSTSEASPLRHCREEMDEVP